MTTQRSIILFIALSLDGCIATEDGGVDWLFTDRDYGYSDFYQRIDTVLMGHTTYQQVLTFGEYPYADKQSIVLTRSPRDPQAGIQFISEQIEEHITALKQLPGIGLWLVGGGQVVQFFLNQDWIDEMILSIHPIVLGKGIPLFPGGPEAIARSFRLTQTQSFNTGLVQLTYKRDRSPGK